MSLLKTSQLVVHQGSPAIPARPASHDCPPAPPPPPSGAPGPVVQPGQGGSTDPVTCDSLFNRVYSPPWTAGADAIMEACAYCTDGSIISLFKFTVPYAEWRHFADTGSLS